MRLRTLATILFYFICTSFLLGQISISKDNSTANSSAILDVKSTEKGLLLPRMTADEIKLIAEPANGLLV